MFTSIAVHATKWSLCEHSIAYLIRRSLRLHLLYRNVFIAYFGIKSKNLSCHSIASCSNTRAKKKNETEQSKCIWTASGKSLEWWKRRQKVIKSSNEWQIKIYVTRYFLCKEEMSFQAQDKQLQMLLHIESVLCLCTENWCKVLLSSRLV